MEIIHVINFFRSNKRDISEPSKIDIDMSNIPKHIAVIMDGNGRWAKERNLPRTLGHRAGVEAIREIVKECNKLGIKYLTLYAFSTENWKRPSHEVNALMNLLVEYLRGEFQELNAQGVVINHIGDISKLPVVCQRELKLAYAKTKDNKGLTLNLALNYGGRAEIVNAFRNIIQDVHLGAIKENDVDESILSRYMYTSSMPDPDIIIRPSGENRLSNFMLWQCAYSELWVSNVKWPDFKKEHLHYAIMDYQKRERRFGGIK